MRKEEVVEGFRRIKRVWPNAAISNTYDVILIPSINLPSRYNRDSTRLLIKLSPASDYIAPDAYVDNGLQLMKGPSHHIDPDLTEAEMLEAGWVKLCIQTEWDPSHGIVNFLYIVLRYLKNLRADRIKGEN